MGNAQQQCMFKNPVKQDLSQSPEGARGPAAKLSIVFYSYSSEGATCLAQPTLYRLKITNFSYLLSFSTFVRVAPFEFIESFTVPETRVFQAAHGEDLVILACTVFDWSTRCLLYTSDAADE